MAAICNSYRDGRFIEAFHKIIRKHTAVLILKEKVYLK